MTDRHPLVAELLDRLGGLPDLEAGRAYTDLIAAAAGPAAEARRAIVARWAADSVSQAEVARRLGVGPGAVYHLWPR